MIPKEEINQYYEDYINEISNYLDQEEEKSYHIGEKIKKIRESKNLTLAEIAQKTGFKEDFLKDIEEEKIAPPLATIIKLSKALDTMLGSLIAEEGDKPYAVIRVTDQKLTPRKTSSHYKYVPLASEVKGRHMETFLVRLYPTKEIDLTTHEGEEFIYVLDGEVKVVIGDKEEVLKMGDSIYYLSTVPHFLTSNNDKPALILAVIYNG